MSSCHKGRHRYTLMHAPTAINHLSLYQKLNKSCIPVSHHDLISRTHFTNSMSRLRHKKGCHWGVERPQWAIFHELHGSFIPALLSILTNSCHELYEQVKASKKADIDALNDLFGSPAATPPPPQESRFGTVPPAPRNFGKYCVAVCCSVWQCLDAVCCRVCRLYYRSRCLEE